MCSGIHEVDICVEQSSTLACFFSAFSRKAPRYNANKTGVN